MKHWRRLERELDCWETPPTLWWRDDDATAPSAALEQLLQLSDRHAIPLHLAVIPAHSEIALAKRLSRSHLTWVLQHGWDHQGYAGPGERKRELGGPRPRPEILQQLRQGRERLQQQFGPRALDILVPPWNRIDDDLLTLLPALGYRRLSILGPRPMEPEGPRQINVHIDIIDWKARRFAGQEAVIHQLVRHLEARRLGSVDATEPTGLMTHHLDHDDACWDFLADLTGALGDRVRWVGGRPCWTAERRLRSIA
ncbi:polysaccharide deacetylase family protein [Marinobacterium aestuariivivens]|uniref:Polysaccharide deacetylase family protein n=1 Tax=Marinobacterium aestuariivivens TaxID=1698799 RepID=A0ABW1ZUR3_9GAMM